jgi:hypothetical protein
MIERFKEPEYEDWPTCPNCGSGKLLAGGIYISCLECNHTGAVDPICDKLVVKTARTRIAIMPNGSRPVLLFSSGGRMGTEERMVMLEKASRLTRKWIHHDVIAKVCETIQKRDVFIPMAVMNHFMEDRLFVTSLLDSRVAMEDAMNLARHQDLCTTFWIVEDSSGPKELAPEMCFPHRTPESGRLMICTHFYGAPSLVSSIDFHTSQKGLRVFKKRVFHDVMMNSWCQQPVQWGIIPGSSPFLQVRWVSIREVHDTINVAACVYENLDGGSVANFSVVDLAAKPGSINLTNIPCSSCEEGVEIVSRKMKEVDEAFKANNLSPDIVFERGWGIEENQAKVILEIRSDPFWKKHSELRP